MGDLYVILDIRFHNFCLSFSWRIEEKQRRWESANVTSLHCSNKFSIEHIMNGSKIIWDILLEYSESNVRIPKLMNNQRKDLKTNWKAPWISHAVYRATNCYVLPSVAWYKWIQWCGKSGIQVKVACPRGWLMHSHQTMLKAALSEN